MFIRGEDGVYRSSLLAEQSWLDHGFSTKLSRDWPGEYGCVRQIHSANVVRADRLVALKDAEQGDAIVSDTLGLWVGIRTADCVPILIGVPRAKMVAAVHAGWRGTAANIAGVTVQELAHLCGAEPEDLLVAIGPAIGRCCFEVGSEVSREFEHLFPEALADLGHIDLIEANRRQLVAAGVRSRNVDILGLCTRCGEAEFESWRRDREQSGRMVAAIKRQG